MALRVNDIAGRLVRTFVAGRRPAGVQEVVWDGGGDDGMRVGPGAYFYRMATEGWQSQRKLVMLAR